MKRFLLIASVSLALASCGNTSTEAPAESVDSVATEAPAVDSTATTVDTTAAAL